jgi:hypothetical protein
MKKIVRYKVKTDRAAENENYVAKVFEELKRTRPPGLRYGSFKLSDGVSFVHIVSVEPEQAGNPLKQLETFKAFTDTLDDRCEELAVASDLEEVGSYRIFGE